MLQKIKDYLCPTLDAEVQNDINKEGLNSLCLLSFAVSVFEFFTVLSFALTRKELDRSAWVSMGSGLFCLTSCLAVFFFTSRNRNRERVPHMTVALCKILLALALSAWAIWVSWRHYPLGDQLFTFFAVELTVVCFITFRPLVSIGLMIGVYGGLYAALYTVDRAACVNSFNLAVLVLVSITGMIVRYRSQLKLSRNAVMLRRNNAALEFANRHDSLTGLGNRKALEEDIARLTGQRVSVFMLDVDYFKQINDRHGHSTGDTVLKETAGVLNSLYPDSFCYRYGGDEFLILTTGGEVYAGETYSLSVPGVSEEVLISVGRAEGTPTDHEQMFALISEADEGLYAVKRKTHMLEYGRKNFS